MKHLKLIILFITFSLGLMCTYTSQGQTIEKGPGFEIQNQSQLNIMFRLFSKDKKVVDAKIAPDNVYQWEINLNDPLTIEVYEPRTKTVQNRIKIDAKGKTKYLVWNPKKFNKPAQYFFPQGNNDSKFFLENNVDQADIKWIK
jgi:hypothetical protein